MFVYEYRATERGIRERNASAISAQRASRLAAQRTSYDAELAERERIERIRADASERARAHARELKLAGFRYRPSLSEIERRACRVFGVTKSELHSNRRIREIVFARQFVMYWAVRLTLLSYPQIGKLMGGRDHTTCIAGKRAYAKKRLLMGRFLKEAR